ncbi:HAD family hydrolase [Nonomuraea ceibae]|uniref:HAD family hydrolase n=1 Tax=Nonomuraea ceibae TaxID=1935170 RepID=UPI001C5E5B85|nr:HAD family hydrolase [Nonomuraea ceibae]
MTGGAVVFDLDGTLVDTMTVVPDAYAGTVRALGGPDVTPEQVVAAWRLGSTPAVLAHFLGRPPTAEDLEHFHRRLDAAAATVRPFPGVVELLGDLARAGRPLGVFTGATRRAATMMLDAAGLTGLFAVVVCGDEVGRAKPAPDGLELACRLLGVRAADAVYVGDAETDLQCARRAGARAVHASWGLPTGPYPGPVARHPRDVLALV